MGTSCITVSEYTEYSEYSSPLGVQKPRLEYIRDLWGVHKYGRLQENVAFEVGIIFYWGLLCSYYSMNYVLYNSYPFMMYQLLSYNSWQPTLCVCNTAQENVMNAHEETRLFLVVVNQPKNKQQSVLGNQSFDKNFKNSFLCEIRIILHTLSRSTEFVLGWLRISTPLSRSILVESSL